MKLILGDCLEQMKELGDNSVDSIVSDPPYGISFMGKKWDYDIPKVEAWEECMRVLKPGGHMLIACGTRTQHRMAVNIEDAGFEIRDLIAWLYGSGFPKSLNVGKVLNKFLKTGNASWNGVGDSTNGVLGYSKLQHKQGYRPSDYSDRHQSKGKITEVGAKRYEGWGTALKPAMELWTLARKPLGEKTVAENVLRWGVGGINIDGSRVKINLENEDRARGKNTVQRTSGISFNGNKKDTQNTPLYNLEQGRFPANLIHDGSKEVVSGFPQSKSSPNVRHNNPSKNTSMSGDNLGHTSYGHNDSGSASRFFYTAKASRSERNKGLEGFEEKEMGRNQSSLDGGKILTGSGNERSNVKKNHHPTVKPVSLMRYLCKLITPPGGVCLDPFMGSGTTGIACKLEAFDFIGIEKEKEYIEIAQARIKAWEKDPQNKLF